MNRIDIPFAVIGVVLRDTTLSPHDHNVFAVDQVVQFGASLERKTGRAVLNDFSVEKLRDYLDARYDLFERAHACYQNHQPMYRVRAEKLRGSNKNARAQDLIARLDPAVNVDMDVLDAAVILPLISNESED